MMLAAVCLLLCWVNPSNSLLINRLQNERRRLIQISFNNKMCLTYNDGDWQKSYYGGDYTYNGIINGKPSYILTNCQEDGPNCKHGKTLSIGTNGEWYIGGEFTREGSDPYCIDKTDAPNDCNNWWDGATHFQACGTTQTADNGISQEVTDKTKACDDANAAPKRTYLTQADKDELLRQFNVQRTKYQQSTWKWSTALEAVAKATADTCIAGHPLSGEQMVSICKQHLNNDPECWKAGWQGMAGGTYVNTLTWDGYKNGECVIHSLRTNGAVQMFMLSTAGHRRPMTGEDERDHNIKFTSVGCAYNYCGGNGIMQCNYM